MSELSVQIRVTSVRNLGKFGGAIFAGVTATRDYYVAVADHKIIPDASLVHKGQHWNIQGTLQRWNDEEQIKVSSAELLRPSGRNIIDWIAQSEACAGIGPVKASRLFERFGPQLIDHIESWDVASLEQVVASEAAQLLCRVFQQQKVAGTLLWLDRLSIDRRTGKKIVDFYKDQAQAKVEENPYRLISFAQDWKTTDRLGRTRFGVAPDDPRRLDAAVEEVLYAGMRGGHTCLPISEVRRRLLSCLERKDLVSKALALGEPSTQYRRVDDMLQPSGAYLMERYIADRLQLIAIGETDGQRSLFTSCPDKLGAIRAAIAEFEAGKGFTLTAEQRAVVATSATENLSLILGGAGTGKTTVLKALYKVMHTLQPNIAIYQVALAGRAAQRMSEATERESMTIAGFLRNVDTAMLGHGSVVVVDEMSMVDVILMFRLLRHIAPGTKLILVGDPSQLPPIGPGLVLHVLAGHPAVPQTELKVTKRQSLASGIPAVAAAIRAHQVPNFDDYRGLGSGVSFVRCGDVEIESNVRRIYGELGGDGADREVQILSTTKNGFGGVLNVNTLFHNEYRRDAKPIYAYDTYFGLVGAQTLDRIPLRVGDLVMYTENDYENGLRNGALGEVESAGRPEDREDWCCSCKFDGVTYQLNSQQVESLRHAYSITIHKSQGSQFKRVIVPIRKSRLLDHTLIYTAVTRGVEQVVLVGDWDAACAAIEAPATAALRHVSLARFLNDFGAEGSRRRSSSIG